MCFSARTLIGYPTHKQRQTAHTGAKRATRPYIYAYIYISYIWQILQYTKMHNYNKHLINFLCNVFQTTNNTAQDTPFQLLITFFKGFQIFGRFCVV